MLGGGASSTLDAISVVVSVYCLMMTNYQVLVGGNYCRLISFRVNTNKLVWLV